MTDRGLAMRKLAQSIVTAILVGTMTCAAIAAPPRPPQPPRYHYHHDGGRLDWLGALLLIGMTAAIFNAATQPSAPPPTRVVPVPVEPLPAPPPTQYIEKPVTAGAWYYYCRSESQYYPYIRTCPEEWELVPTVPAQ